MCILSFPVVNCTICEREDGELKLSSVSVRDEVCIEVRPQQPTVRVSLSISLGPQPVHIVVDLRRVETRAVEVSVSICGKGKFSWEDWRNDFTSRLAGVRQWHESNDLECPRSFEQNEASHQKYGAQILLHAELERQ